MASFKITVLSHGNGHVTLSRSSSSVFKNERSKKAVPKNKIISFIEKSPLLKAFLVYPKNSFYDSFLFCHFVTKCLGLSSFSVPKTIKSANVHFTIFDVLAYVIFLGSSIFVMVASLLDSYIETDSVILNGCIKSISFSTLVISLPPITLNVINRHNIWKITQLVSAVDDQLLHLGVKINHGTDFYKLVVIVIMTSILFYASYVVHIYVFSDPAMSWTYWFFILYSKGCYYIFCVTSGLYYAVVHNRLCHLNCAIVSNYNVHSNFIKRRIFVISNTNRTLIVRCSKIYEKINQVLDLINYCFSVPLMLCLGLCFAYTVFTIYSGIRLFKYKGNDKEFYFIIRNTVWNILFALCQLFVIIIGHKITRAGQITAYLTHLAISQDITDQQLHDNFMFLSQQVHHRTPVSSCWLFKYDWTLVYSIAAALATYLIVLLQVENELSAHNIN